MCVVGSRGPQSSPRCATTTTTRRSSAAAQVQLRAHPLRQLREHLLARVALALAVGEAFANHVGAQLRREILGMRLLAVALLELDEKAADRLGRHPQLRERSPREEVRVGLLEATQLVELVL